MIEIASLGSFFDEHIVDTHKLPAFIYLVFFLGTFAFIRTSAHLIRAQVRWWPGNVEVGGTHIHHLVWGILLLMISGWVGIVVAPEPPGREIVAAAFGIGTGLTLDEFALWLELKDVYWSAEGRKSIDAVIIAGILASFGVLGFTIWVEAADDVEIAVHAVIGFVGVGGLVFGLINCAKEKFGVALLGLVIPFLSFICACRLGRPTSPWARLLYRSDKKKERARKRFENRKMFEPPHVPSMRHVRESLRRSPDPDPETNPGPGTP
jgi:lysyl-tRNA synthetase class 2